MEHILFVLLFVLNFYIFISLYLTKYIFLFLLFLSFLPKKKSQTLPTCHPNLFPKRAHKITNLATMVSNPVTSKFREMKNCHVIECNV